MVTIELKMARARALMLRYKLRKLELLRNRMQQADFYMRAFLWEEISQIQSEVMEDVEPALRSELDGAEL